MKIFGITGWSGSGKTTLIEQIVPRLVRKGLVVSLIKHAHHSFDVDHPGKDSYRHRHAGCTEVLVSSQNRWVIMHELRGAPEPTLDEQVGRVSPCDLLLIEGYKRYPMPKLEVWRSENSKPFLHPDDDNIVALATDVPQKSGPTRRFDLNDHDGIADFVLEFNGLK